MKLGRCYATHDEQKQRNVDVCGILKKRHFEKIK